MTGTNEAIDLRPEEVVAALLERAGIRMAAARSESQAGRATSYALRAWAAVYALVRTSPDIEPVLRDRLPVSAEYVTTLLLGASRDDVRDGPGKVAFVCRVMANQASSGSPQEAVEASLRAWVAADQGDEFDEWLVAEVANRAGVLVARAA